MERIMDGILWTLRWLVDNIGSRLQTIQPSTGGYNTDVFHRELAQEHPVCISTHRAVVHVPGDGKGRG